MAVTSRVASSENRGAVWLEAGEAEGGETYDLV